MISYTFDDVVQSNLAQYKILVVNIKQENIWFKSDTMDFVALHKFVQYVLDSCSAPETYVIVTDAWELALPIYCGICGMYKRSFDQKIKDELTGTIPAVIIHDPITDDFSISKRKEGK